MDIFRNQGINVTNLPQAENVNLIPIEPVYWNVLKWSWMIGALLLLGTLTLILLFGFPSNTYLLLSIPGLAILLLIILWLMRISFLLKAYALREKDIIYRTGWLIRRISICPFSRVQHCSVNAGPLERKLKLSSLSVYTAGAEGADFKIPGLKEETAFSLRDFILTKTIVDEPTGN